MFASAMHGMDADSARAIQQHVRGLPLSRVLMARGKLFQDSTGDAATFALSQPGPHVDVFLSHTWSTPRWKKHMALSLHFNFTKALLAAFAVGVLLAALTASGGLPVMEVDPDGYMRRYPSAPVALVVVPVVFHLALYHVHDFLPQDSTRVFLDKACIEQSDPVLKMQGIANLGVTCFFSSSIVVLDCEDYLQRLWTVYELGSFLLRNCKIVFLPVKLPPAVTIMCFETTLAALVNELCKTRFVSASAPELTTYAQSVALLPGVIAVAIIFRSWAKEQSRRLSRLEAFSIATARCFDEGDRAPVLRNVTHLLYHTGFVGANTSVSEAVDVFDGCVRLGLPQDMWSSSLGYKHLVLMNLAFVAHAFDILASDILGEAPWQVVVYHVLFWVSQGVVYGPLMLTIIHSLVRRRLRISSWAEVTYMVVVVVCVTALAMAIDQMQRFSASKSPNLSWSVVFYAIQISLEGVILLWMYFPEKSGTLVRHSVDDAESLAQAQTMIQALQMQWNIELGPSNTTCEAREYKADQTLPSVSKDLPQSRSNDVPTDTTEESEADQVPTGTGKKRMRI